MLKLLKCLLFLTLTTPAQAQMIDLSKRPEGPPMVMKTFTAELPQDGDAAVAELRARIGHLVEIRQTGATVLAGFAGFEAPEPLRDYLQTLLPSLSPGLLGPDMPVSLSIALMPAEGVTMVQVMMSVPRTDDTSLFGGGVPDGGVILMDDATPKDCAGQVVLAHPAPTEPAGKAYAEALKTQGFTMQTPPGGNTSFFVGHRGDCALFLYTQPDFTTPDHTMVVIRFTED